MTFQSSGVSHLAGTPNVSRYSPATLLLSLCTRTKKPEVLVRSSFSCTSSRSRVTQSSEVCRCTPPAASQLLGHPGVQWVQLAARSGAAPRAVAAPACGGIGNGPSHCQSNLPFGAGGILFLSHTDAITPVRSGGVTGARRQPGSHAGEEGCVVCGLA